MSYFPEDIPFMSKEELRENGIRIPKDVPDTNVGETISRQAAIDAVTDELDMIDHVPQWVFDRLEGRLRQLSPAQPERVWSELDKQLIDDLLRKIYELQGTSLSMDGVIAKKYYINELYGVLFGRGEKPKWMT